MSGGRGRLAPTSMPTWLLYGANGYSGELIARRAVALGLEPILAGRNGEAVARLASELGLMHRAFGLEEPARLVAELSGIELVLHCAGPFSATSRPMVEACLAAGAHYLDITGEISVFEGVLRQDAKAKAAGVVLLPGVGFDVVPTDCLAARLHQALPEADSLELAFWTAGGETSRGTLNTMIEGLGRSGAIRQDGKIVPVPMAFDAKEIDFGRARRWAMTIPWGDVSTAFRTTGIPNIRVYSATSPRTIRRLRRWRSMLPLLGRAPFKRLLRWWVARRPPGPDAAVRERARTYLWGQATAADGRRVTTTLETPEGYTLTAHAAVECARRVLSGEIAPGAWTPAAAFGAELIASIEGTRWGELVRSVAPKVPR